MVAEPPLITAIVKVVLRGFVEADIASAGTHPNLALLAISARKLSNRSVRAQQERKRA